MAGTMGCSLLLVIILLISTVSGVIEVSFEKGVPRLNNSLYCDYYFACHTEGETLQWRVGNNVFNYSGQSTIGSVFGGSVSNCNYTATLLSLKPLSSSRSFKSVLILTCQSNFDMPIICSDGSLLKTINIPEKELSLMAETTNNLVYLEHVLYQNLVNTDNSTCTNVFVCGVNNVFMDVQFGNVTFLFTEFDSIRREHNEVQSTSVQQAILIDKEPYSLVVAMIIVGSEVINVTCGFSQNIKLLSSMQCRPVTTISETTGTMESKSSTGGESSTIASGGSSTLPPTLGLIIAVGVLVAIIVIIIIIFIVIGYFKIRNQRPTQHVQEELPLNETVSDGGKEIPWSDNNFSGIKKPKKRMNDINYNGFFEQVQYIFLTRNKNTFNAATTILTAPGIENITNEQLTCIDEGLYIGMIGSHPVCLVNETENCFLDKLKKVVKLYFPNAKFLVFVGRCFGVDPKKINLADVLISRSIRHATESEAYTELIAPEIRSQFCLYLEGVEGLKVSKYRAAKHFLGQITSGEKILDDKGFRNFALTSNTVVLEETSGKLLTLFKDGINMGNNTTKQMQVITIGAVTGYVDGDIIKEYDMWQFMASQAAFHYVASKMIHPHDSGDISYKIKEPKRKSYIDYQPFCNRIQYMILIMGQDELHAATTTILAPDIEENGITEIDTGVYIGMIGSHPVGLFHCHNPLKYYEILQQAIINHFPNTKYFLGVGGCGGTSTSSEKANLADVLISKEIYEIIYDGESYDHVIHNMTQEIKDIFCKNPQNVKGLELPGNRRAEHLVVRIASGTNIEMNKYMRELAIKNPQNYGFEEIGVDMLNFQANMSRIGKCIHVILICGICFYGNVLEDCFEWQYVASQAAFNYVAAKIKMQE